MKNIKRSTTFIWTKIREKPKLKLKFKNSKLLSSWSFDSESVF